METLRRLCVWGGGVDAFKNLVVQVMSVVFTRFVEINLKSIGSTSRVIVRKLLLHHRVKVIVFGNQSL